MRVVLAGLKGGRRGPKLSLSIVGMLLGAMVLVLLLTTAAWAAETATSLQAASTTSTDASATTTAGATTITTAAGAATPATTGPGSATTAAGAAAGTAGLIPPILGRAPLNPASWKTAQMVVQVWPEYDKNAVLVIMNLDLPAEVALPATFKFAVPKDAEIAGIGEIDPSGNFTFNYANSYPPVDTSGPDWDIATIQVQKYRSLQIDYYYDPGLPAGAGLRSFPLLLQVPMDTAALSLHVQEPTRATDFNVQPALQGSGAAEDGFTYAVASFSDVKAGSTFGYLVSYNKPDATPSATPGTTSSSKLSTTTVLIVVIAVIVVIFGGVIIYLLYRKGGKGARGASGQKSAKARQNQARQKARNGRQAAESASVNVAAGGKTKKPPAQAKSAPNGGTAGGDDQTTGSAPSGYCAACGEELIKNARFCPNCGEAQGR